MKTAATYCISAVAESPTAWESRKPITQKTLWSFGPKGFFSKKNGGYLHPSVAIGVMAPLIGP